MHAPITLSSWFDVWGLGVRKIGDLGSKESKPKEALLSESVNKASNVLKP